MGDIFVSERRRDSTEIRDGDTKGCDLRGNHDGCCQTSRPLPNAVSVGVATVVHSSSFR